MRAINVKRQDRGARGDRSAAALRGARLQVLMLGSRAIFAQNEPMDNSGIATVAAGVASLRCGLFADRCRQTVLGSMANVEFTVAGAECAGRVRRGALRGLLGD